MRLSQKIFKFKSNLLFLQVTRLLLCLTLGLWLSSIQAANQNTSDIFYIPMGSTPIKFDGQWTEAEWYQANYFTFGYEGDPEVELYAFWLKTTTENTLNLAIHIDDITALPDQDQFYLCCDPLNEGTQLYWFKITRANNSTLHVQKNSGEWTYATNNIQHRTYSQPNYWEAELKIPLTLLENNNLPFGMYLRVFDYFDTAEKGQKISNYIEYIWPALSTASSIPPEAVPPASDWAKGQLINSTVSTRPDPFFSNREQVLYMDNANHDIQIIPGQQNIILTKINNHYLNGAGGIDNVNLLLQWSEFGVTNFKNITTDAPFSIQQNAPLVRSNAWTPAANCSGTVIIRAEVQKKLDAITCNNGTRRDMMFIQVHAGDVVNVEATVTASSDAGPHSSGRLASRTDSPEMLQFFIDRSGLDSTIADSLWQIKFDPLAGDKLLPAGKDRFRLAVLRGESKKFGLQVTAPNISKLDSVNCAWILKIIHWLFFKEGTMPGKLVVSPASLEQPSTAGVSRVNTAAFPTAAERSRLRIQVTKEGQLYEIGQTVHQHLMVLGYFGIELEILKTQWKLDGVKLLIMILILFALVYFIWRRRFAGR